MMGAHYQDQVPYSRATVEDHLAAIFDPNFILLPPKVARSVEVKGPNLRTGMPGFYDTCADVCRAYRLAPLTRTHRIVLLMRWLGYTTDAIAAKTDEDPEAVHFVRDEAIQMMTDYLSGRTTHE